MKAKFLPFILLLATGCSRQEPAVQVQKGPSYTLTQTQTKAQFTPQQLSGKWTANAAFDSSVPAAQRSAYVKGLAKMSLTLKPDKTFEMRTATGAASGTWQVVGESLLITMRQQNGKTVDQIISEQEKKGLPKGAAEKIRQPAKFDISEDGSELTSQTQSSRVLVILKKV